MNMGVIIATIAIIVLIGIGSVYFAFCAAFLMPKNFKKDVHELPKGLRIEWGKERMHQLIDETDVIPFEEVYIQSFDGLKLFGRYYHVADGAPLQIQFHGYKSPAVRDFAGGNKIAREMGHNTIIVDQRAHGKSEGRVITFGVNERKDALAWANYAMERFGEDVPVILSGVSMGAATVLMASALNLPSNVKGVIADCPYSDAVEAISISSEKRNFPKIIKILTKPLARIAAKTFGGFDIHTENVLSAVENSKVPILIIHGEDDRVVPCKMSEDIFNACKGIKYRETFPEAGHGVSFILDEKRYERITKNFINECLSKA